MNAALSKSVALSEAKKLLAEWLTPPKPFIHTRDSETGADLLVKHDGLVFVVEHKASGSAASVRDAIEKVKQHASDLGRKTIPVVSVQYMGDVGRGLCDASGVSWFDLSGNARIIAPKLRIIVDGRPNKFVRRGRPSSAFAPKSARIARRLLIEPRHSFKQQDLAGITRLDDGFTSRIVNRLIADGFLVRDAAGAVHVRDADLLLDAWRDAYDFERHDILRGHVTFRNGQELQTRLGAALKKAKIPHAATGLGAAWLHAKFADFRLVTMFVAEPPSEELMRSIGFRPEPKGANVWLVVPNDDGVFDGAGAIDGVQCVHPVQTYVDLKSQPERAKEAADELRARVVGGR